MLIAVHRKCVPYRGPFAVLDCFLGNFLGRSKDLDLKRERPAAWAGSRSTSALRHLLAPTIVRRMPVGTITQPRRGSNRHSWSSVSTIAPHHLNYCATPYDTERRSTIGAHPALSEAPHSGSSTPHPKTDPQQKSKLHPGESSRAPGRQKPQNFLSRLAFRRSWARGPRHSENTWAEMCHIYRRTRRY